MLDEEERNRVRQLEERLARLEDAVKGLKAELASTVIPPLIPTSAVKHDTVFVAPPSAADVPELAATKAVHFESFAKEVKAVTALTQNAVPEATQDIPPPSRAPVAQQRHVEGGGLEQAIGLKWAGWIGAIVLVMSAGMGFVFAYEQGWFDRVPAQLKLILMALVGFSLIGAGEVVYRKVNQLASTGLFGAGVAILFIVAYAGNHYYQLYPPNVAFWVMALAVSLGGLIAWRGKFVSIAMLAIVGGNLVPIMLSTGEPPGMTLLAYALFLQVLALVLSYVGHSPKWWTLRTAALLSSTLWTLVVIDANTTNAYTVLFFELVMAALFHSEVVASAATYGARTLEGVELKYSPLESAGGAVFCLCVTTALCAFGLLTLSQEPRNVKTSWVLALAFFFGWQGLNLAAWFGARLKALADSFKIQAALLLVVAVPVALKGYWMTGTWGLLAVAFVALGARIKFSGTRALATMTLLLGFVKWFVWDTGFWCFDDASAANALMVFNGYCGAGLMLGISCIACLLISKSQTDEPAGTEVTLFRFLLANAPIALLFWAGTVEIHRYFSAEGARMGAMDAALAEQLSLSVFWSVFAMVLIVTGFVFVRATLRYAGLGLFMLTLIKVALFDLSFLSQGYRILSFAALGFLLLLTSVLYGYFSPKLLPKSPAAA